MSDLPARAPEVNRETRPFWDATAGGRIHLPRCDDCGLFVWYPRAMCPDCRSTSLTWEDLSGRGTVYSFTVSRRGHGRWREHAPYVVAFVTLDEGPRLLTNIVDCDPETVAIGMDVEAVFDDTGEGSALVRFRPIDDEETI